MTQQKQPMHCSAASSIAAVNPWRSWKRGTPLSFLLLLGTSSLGARRAAAFRVTGGCLRVSGKSSGSSRRSVAWSGRNSLSQMGRHAKRPRKGLATAGEDVPRRKPLLSSDTYETLRTLVVPSTPPIAPGGGEVSAQELAPAAAGDAGSAVQAPGYPMPVYKFVHYSCSDLFPTINSARKAVNRGLVLVDGYFSKNDLHVEVGQTIVIRRRSKPNAVLPPPHNLPYTLEVLAEDDDFACVVKPAGVLVHGGKLSEVLSKEEANKYQFTSAAVASVTSSTPPADEDEEKEEDGGEERRQEEREGGGGGGEKGEKPKLKQPALDPNRSNPINALLYPKISSVLLHFLSPSKSREDPLKTPAPVHRLDAPTGGVLLCAKTRGAQRAFSDAFEQRLVQKRYRALVHGGGMPPTGTISVPLSGKEALTHFQTLSTTQSPTAGGKLTLVELYPKTGRTHQLRKHLSAIGHPIVGDDKYMLAPEEQQQQEEPMQLVRGEGLFLWAVGIKLAHPKEGEPAIDVSTQEPDAWKRWIDAEQLLHDQQEEKKKEVSAEGAGDAQAPTTGAALFKDNKPPKIDGLHTVEKDGFQYYQYNWDDAAAAQQQQQQQEEEEEAGGAPSSERDSAAPLESTS